MHDKVLLSLGVKKEYLDKINDSFRNMLKGLIKAYKEAERTGNKTIYKKENARLRKENWDLAESFPDDQHDIIVVYITEILRAVRERRDEQHALESAKFWAEQTAISYGVMTTAKPKN